MLDEEIMVLFILCTKKLLQECGHLISFSICYNELMSRVSHFGLKSMLQLFLDVLLRSTSGQRKKKTQLSFKAEAV